MLGIEQGFDRQRFNCLLAIEDADMLIRKSDSLNYALRVLGPIFIRNGVAGSWGLSLLHRHWNLEESEIPLQVLSKSTVPREYESTPCELQGCEEHWPLILGVSAQHRYLQPLEFSNDESARRANRILVCHHDFVEEVCEAVLHNDWAETFGIIALKDVPDEFALLESNYLERISILREVGRAEVDGKTVIQTSWRFSVGAGGNCESSCFSTCTVPGSAGGSHTHNHAKAHKPG